MSIEAERRSINFSIKNTDSSKNRKFTLLRHTALKLPERIRSRKNFQSFDSRNKRTQLTRDGDFVVIQSGEQKEKPNMYKRPSPKRPSPMNQGAFRKRFDNSRSQRKILSVSASRNEDRMFDPASGFEPYANIQNPYQSTQLSPNNKNFQNAEFSTLAPTYESPRSSS